MPLFGNLATLPLADLLQCVGNLGKSGCLEISHDRVKTRVFFRGDQIIACSADDPPKLLGHFLMFHGAIDEDTLRRALALHESTGKLLGVVLRNMGAVSSDDLGSLLALKAEETLLGIFEFEEGVFAFRENQPLDTSAMGVAIAAQDLMLRGAERLDDLARARAVFAGPMVVPERTDREADDALLSHWPTRLTYEAIDGERTAEEIALHVHGAESSVLLCLYGLWERGLAKARSEQPGRAKVAAQGRSAADAAAGATDRAALKPDLGEARRHLASGNFAGALEILGAARALDPTDSAVRSLIEDAEQGWIDQIGREGLSLTKIPVVLKSRQALQTERLAAGEYFLLNLIDGSWDIKSLIWVTPMRQLETLRCLKKLADRGFIEFLEPKADGTTAFSHETTSTLSEK